MAGNARANTAIANMFVSLDGYVHPTRFALVTRPAEPFDLRITGTRPELIG